MHNTNRLFASFFVFFFFCFAFFFGSCLMSGKPSYSYLIAICVFSKKCLKKKKNIDITFIDSINARPLSSFTLHMHACMHLHVQVMI